MPQFIQILAGVIGYELAQRTMDVVQLARADDQCVGSVSKLVWIELSCRKLLCAHAVSIRSIGAVVYRHIGLCARNLLVILAQLLDLDFQI